MIKINLTYIIRLILVLALMCTITTGCGSSQADSDEENIADDVMTEEQVDNSPYAEYAGSLLYSIVTPAWYSATLNDMIIYEFDERDDMFNLYTQDNCEEVQTEAFYVTETPHYFDSEYYTDSSTTPPYKLLNKSILPISDTYYNSIYEYKKATSQTKYLYYGEFDENSMPTGLGILFSTEKVDDSGSNVYIVKYIGNFKNGLYDGYGIEFECVELDYDLNIEYIKYYEGYFEQGVHVLKGNRFTGWYDSIKYQSGIFDPYNMELQCDIATEEYDESTDKRFCRYYYLNNLYYEGEVSSKHEFDGYGKLYVPYTNILHYEGNFVKGKKSGKGKLYSEETGNLIYEGELLDDLYNGEGILYDESGRLIHEGMFANGNIA